MYFYQQRNNIYVAFEKVKLKTMRLLLKIKNIYKKKH